MLLCWRTVAAARGGVPRELGIPSGPAFGVFGLLLHAWLGTQETPLFHASHPGPELPPEGFVSPRETEVSYLLFRLPKEECQSLQSPRGGRCVPASPA